MNPIGLILFALAPITGLGFLTIPPSTPVDFKMGYSRLFANESCDESCDESTQLPEYLLSKELLPDVTIEQKP